jgi:hypothetical protein
MDVKVVGAMRENLFLGGGGGEGRHYFLNFVGFARLSFCYDWCE